MLRTGLLVLFAVAAISALSFDDAEKIAGRAGEMLSKECKENKCKSGDSVSIQCGTNTSKEIIIFADRHAYILYIL